MTLRDVQKIIAAHEWQRGRFSYAGDLIFYKATKHSQLYRMAHNFNTVLVWHVRLFEV